MTNPEVSIIIPCFNYGHYLPFALESVKSQTFPSWECLIIDDGSTDLTSEVANAYQESDVRFRYLKQDHRGPSIARNRGLKEKVGQFVQFLDADDAIEKDKIASQVDFLKAHPNIDIVYGEAVFCKDEENLGDNIIPSILFSSKSPSENESLMIRALFSGNFIVTHAPLLRAEIIESIGYFDEKLNNYEDWDYWLRCALGGKSFFYLERPHSKALVRMHQNSLSRKRGSRLDKINGEVFLRLKLMDHSLPSELYSQNLERLNDLDIKASVLKYLESFNHENFTSLFQSIKKHRSFVKGLTIATAELVPPSLRGAPKKFLKGRSDL